ncbi:hypothetical protein ACFQZE_17990 [Paenibacillus sp. GCM10027627]|uniref:hypothetical protein n=1 Tax=unclassified Paenibacillus TaxID=185978 RepID=UPI0036331323
MVIKGLKRSSIALLSAFLLIAALIIPSSVSAASYIPPFETDSPSNPHIFNAGDWSFPTLTPGDTDYFKVTNTFSYSRAYSLIVDSPDGTNYMPSHISIRGNGRIIPVIQDYGFYRFDIILDPGAFANIEISNQIGPYSPNTYLVVIQ